jgi:hypothetical protein
MRWTPRIGGAPSLEVAGRVEGARRATVLRYGGSLWVNGYWPDTTVSIELRPLRRAAGRVILVGPPFGAGRSIAIDLDPAVSIERLAEELADWIETPALGVRRAERTWSAVARGIAAALNGGSFQGVSA